MSIPTAAITRSRRCWFRFSLRTLFVLVTVCGTWLFVQVQWNAFESASDPNGHVLERIEAASRLNGYARAQLRARLVAELPGNWDLAALNTIHVLGKIGYSETISVLEAVRRTPNEASGKFGVAIEAAIAEIRRRLNSHAKRP